MHTSRRLLLTLLVVACFSARGEWTRFEVRDAAQRDIVQFVSDAPLEKVVGMTSAVTGWIALNPQRLKDGIQGEFEVDVRTFDTGMLLRNEHFRNKFLQTAQHPFSKFRFKKLSSASKGRMSSGDPVEIQAAGEIEICGVTQPIDVALRAVYHTETERTRERLDGNLLRLSATFELDVVPFGVYWAEELALRLARNVRVNVDALATDHTAPVLIPGADRGVADSAREPQPKKRPSQKKKRK